MPRDMLTLGPTPFGEHCEQVGPHYRPNVARAECRAFAAQLARVHGAPPEGARFRVTSNPHEFGTYHEVAVEYDEENEAAVAYAYKVEGATPEEWDDIARAELRASQQEASA